MRRRKNRPPRLQIHPWYWMGAAAALWLTVAIPPLGGPHPFSVTFALAATVGAVRTSVIGRRSGRGRARRALIAIAAAHQGRQLNRDEHLIFGVWHWRRFFIFPVWMIVRASEDDGREAAHSGDEIPVSYESFDIVPLFSVIRDQDVVLVSEDSARPLPTGRALRGFRRSRQLARAGLGTVAASQDEVAQLIRQLAGAEYMGELEKGKP